ncbi:hypothetical protein LOAG_00555 [Loa loa]|uniref:Uncharacterized protein n=1 Tax=Loa loa TaxID=7209 RepID=A0A1S0UAX2_LOALO|nr:hypothetical protein LOAG_00555 [Loa loa]EFO27918.1 hypothetical protein LOAG_00555 [Loa loa]
MPRPGMLWKQACEHLHDPTVTEKVDRTLNGNGMMSPRDINNKKCARDARKRI